jgi:hypothetical protein
MLHPADLSREAGTEHDPLMLPVWVRINETFRQKCQAWYDQAENRWILDDHPLVEAGFDTSQDPDWYIAQQGADKAFHQIGDAADEAAHRDWR